MFGTGVNLSKPSGSAPGGSAPKSEIIIYEVDDIDVFPATDADGVKMIAQFVTKAGKFPVKIYSTKSKTEAGYDSNGDEDNVSIMSKIMLQYPGNKLEVKEFTQRMLGKDVIILHKACGDSFYEVVGTPCAPLQIKPSKKDGNDGRHHEFTFEQFAKSNQVPKHYEGTVTFAAPFAVTSVATTALLKSNGTQYTLPALAVTAAVTVSAIDLDHGQMVTLIGSGGANPATVTQGASGLVTVSLINGTTWAGINGAILTLQVFKAGGITYLNELSRS